MVKRENASALRVNAATIAGIAAVSLLYFADTLLKASQKLFWFDELFTVYLCRLPSFHDTWAGVTHGVDFNPPLFYLIIRGAQRLFGDGLIATRLPSALGVWMLCLCLFLFVGRRMGAVSGFIAGVFPLFTLAQYYSYEARAHGIVLGWLGLALICWQRSVEEEAPVGWSIGFAGSIAGALLTHIYAVYILVPFGLVELYALFRCGSRRWRILAILAITFGLVTVAVYLPLVHQYRAAFVSTNYFPASFGSIQGFVVDAFSRATVIFLLSFVFSALQRRAVDQEGKATTAIPLQEVLLAIAFAGIPLIGLIGCKLSHGPFLDRYFLSSITGVAILLGFSVRRQAGNFLLSNALAICMFFLLVIDLAATVHDSSVHRIVLREPSTQLMLSTDPSDPMRLYQSLSMDRGLDVMVLPSLEYLYFYKYAKPSVVSHLYFWAPAGDVNQGGYEKLVTWAHLNLKIAEMGPFLSTHDKFLVYANKNAPQSDAMQTFATAGYLLKSVQDDGDGIMYEYEKLPVRSANPIGAQGHAISRAE